LFLLMMGT